MLKRLIQWIKSLFNTTNSTSAATPTVPTNPAPATASYPEIDRAIAHLSQFGPVTAYLLQTRMARGLTDAEVAYAESKGVKFKDDPKPQDSVVIDHSGFTLTNQGYLINELTPGESYTFTYPSSRLVEIWPVGGDEITHVNGVHSPGGGKYPGASGSLTVVLNGIGLNGKIRTGLKTHP